MASQIGNVKEIAARSNEMLELARRFAEQAEALPVDDQKRVWLAEQAQRLISEARSLTEKAKEQVIRYK